MIEGERGIEQGQEQSSNTMFDARLLWTENLMQGRHGLMRLATSSLSDYSIIRFKEGK